MHLFRTLIIYGAGCLIAGTQNLYAGEDNGADEDDILYESVFESKATELSPKVYYADGTLKAEFTYKEGKRNGLAKLYDKNGALAYEAVLTDDVLNGTVKKYYKTAFWKQKPYIGKTDLTGR